AVTDVLLLVLLFFVCIFFFFSSRRRHTRSKRDWSSDVCSSDLISMWTMGLNQSVIGVNKNLSLINLNLITGHIGKPGSGPLSLRSEERRVGKECRSRWAR